MGDLNISGTDLDVGIGEDNRRRWLREGKCSFLPEEREWLWRDQELGVSDVYRRLYPETDDRFSWFDYRSRGFERDPKRGLRIDLILATESLAERVTDSGISYIRQYPWHAETLGPLPGLGGCPSVTPAFGWWGYETQDP